MAKLNYNVTTLFIVLMYLTVTVLGCNGGLGQCSSDIDCISLSCTLNFVKPSGIKPPTPPTLMCAPPLPENL